MATTPRILCCWGSLWRWFSQMRWRWPLCQTHTLTLLSPVHLPYIKIIYAHTHTYRETQSLFNVRYSTAFTCQPCFIDFCIYASFLASSLCIMFKSKSINIQPWCNSTKQVILCIDYNGSKTVLSDLLLFASSQAKSEFKFNSFVKL